MKRNAEVLAELLELADNLPHNPNPDLQFPPLPPDKEGDPDLHPEG